jgi:hypothetical protein
MLGMGTVIVHPFDDKGFELLASKLAPTNAIDHPGQ